MLVLAARFWTDWQPPLFAFAAEQSRLKGLLALLLVATDFWCGVTEATELWAFLFVAIAACPDLPPAAL